MKKLFTLSLIFSWYFLFPQDTLVKKSGEKELVKVTEVNPAWIKYRKTANLNGPIYNLGKEEIWYIKYEGGHVDSFNVAKILVTDIPPQKKQLTYYGAEIMYNSQRISTKQLLNIINAYPDEAARSKMQASYRRMEAHRDIGIVCLTSGLVLGCATVILTNPYVTGLTEGNIVPSKEGYEVALVGIFSGAAMRISAFAVSQAQRNKKKAKIAEIVAIHNGDYDFK